MLPSDNCSKKQGLGQGGELYLVVKERSLLGLMFCNSFNNGPLRQEVNNKFFISKVKIIINNDTKIS